MHLDPKTRQALRRVAQSAIRQGCTLEDAAQSARWRFLRTCPLRVDEAQAELEALRAARPDLDFAHALSELWDLDLDAARMRLARHPLARPGMRTRY